MRKFLVVIKKISIKKQFLFKLTEQLLFKLTRYNDIFKVRINTRFNLSFKELRKCYFLLLLDSYKHSLLI